MHEALLFVERSLVGIGRSPGQSSSTLLVAPDEWHLHIGLTKAVLALVLTDNRATLCLLFLECLLVAPLELRRDNFGCRAV